MNFIHALPRVKRHKLSHYNSCSYVGKGLGWGMEGDMEEELDYILTVIRPRNVLQLNNNSASQALEQKDERREDINELL